MMCLCTGVHAQVNQHSESSERDWTNQSFGFDLMREFPSHNKELVQEIRDVGICGGAAHKLDSHQFDGRICGKN